MKTSANARIEMLNESGLWGEQTLHGLLAQHAAERPDALACKDQPNRESLTGDLPLALTWSELDHASDNVAAALQQSGVTSGDIVMVQLPNIVELLVTYYAMSKLGAVLSPVPTAYGIHELRLISAALETDMLLTVTQMRGEPLADKASSALPEGTVLIFGEDLHLFSDSPTGDLVTYANDANAILTICWTSGTTGTPKGVPRSHNMWLATGRCTATAGGMLSDDVLLNPFPLVNMASIGGFVFPAAILGSAIVLHHPLDPPLFLQQMQDEKVTFTIAPPALLNQLAKTPAMWEQFDFSALRRIGSGSAPLAPWMIETFSRNYQKEIVNFYGSNEGISLFATPETAPAADVRAAMFALPEQGGVIETMIADVETRRVITENGVSGELLIRGATVFDGYYAHDNADVFSDDGYFRTGDLVELCGEDGEYYRIVGRCKDIINRGGMKISPQEIDIALEGHPDFAEAAVCAYSDERLGEKICACVVVSEPGLEVSLESLQKYLIDKGFAKFKLPERVEVFVALPRNPLGKVQRFLLQDDVARR
ncbi:MAG: class I adenylate-forming enzyme family protein [Halioglobus sp.]